MNYSTNTSHENLTPLDQLTYEQAFAELEGIVAALETEEHPLDEALTLYERGQSLARFCAGRLDQAELKVQQLSGEELLDVDS